MSSESSCTDTEPANHTENDFLQLVRYHTVFNNHEGRYMSCMYADSIVEKSDNINYQIKATPHLISQNSHLIGSTFLHIAVHNMYERNVKFLLERGADFTLKNDKGLTALLHLFITETDRYIQMSYKKLGRLDADELMDKILTAHVQMNNPTNPCNEHGLSHLHIACTTNNVKVIELFLDNGEAIDQAVSHDSPYYPGYTPLHLAVDSFCSEAVELLLKRGASMYIKNADGLTPLQLFIREKIDMASRRYQKLYKNPPKMTKSVRLPPQVVSMEKITKLFLIYDDKVNDVNVVGPLGLSHFHIACTTLNNGISIVKHYLEHDNVDVNRQVASDSPICAGYTALDLASHFNVKVVKLLRENGANQVEDEDGFTAYDLYLKNRNKSKNFKEETNVASQASSNPAPTYRIFYEHEYSKLPKLHVLCNYLDIEAIKTLLSEDDIDVNERAPSSSIWPGCTALHIILSFTSCSSNHDVQRQNETDVITKLLLDNGADVTLMDEQMQTPLHVASKSITEGYFMNREVHNHFYHRIRLLLQYHKDFKVNPTDNRGISHFHIACRVNEADAVKKFLDSNNDIDVNTRIDYFSKELPGCTPINLAASSYATHLLGEEVKIRTIDLLLKHGAEPRVEDSCGNNPLHGAAKHGPAREKVFEILINSGVDVNEENIIGETPLEILLKSVNVMAEEIEFLLSHGHRHNFFNSINHKGYVALCSSEEYHQSIQRTALEAMINSASVVKTDDRGRTVIHNLVSTGRPMISEKEYIGLFKSMRLYCDIDDQDAQGRTALHYASQFENEEAFLALLSLGADINVLDVDGETAYAYTMYQKNFIQLDEAFKNERKSGYISSDFMDYLCKLHFRDLDLCPNNLEIARQTRVMYMRYLSKETFVNEVDDAKNVKIGSTSIVIYDFLSETGAVAAYPTMTQFERAEVDKFFQTIDDCSFKQLIGMLNLQYRKALARLPLIDSATDSLRTLLGFPLPDVCCRLIIRYLKNSELADLIAAASEDLC